MTRQLTKSLETFAKIISVTSISGELLDRPGVERNGGFRVGGRHPLRLPLLAGRGAQRSRYLWVLCRGKITSQLRRPKTFSDMRSSSSFMKHSDKNSEGNGCKVIYDYTDKKKDKFSSYMKKFRRERLQSHIWLTASSYIVEYLRISSYIRKPVLIYDFATDLIWIPYIWGKFRFLFYRCGLSCFQVSVSWNTVVFDFLLCFRSLLSIT